MSSNATRPPWRTPVEIALGALFGWAAAEYFGFTLLLIPGMAFVLSLVLLSNMLRGAQRPFLVAASLQFAHIAWGLIGVILTGRWIMLPELLIPIVGLVWLVLRPGRGPVILLAGYHLLLVGFNIVQLVLSYPPGVNPQALYLHLLIRGWLLVALAAGMARLRRERLENEAGMSQSREPSA